MQEISFYMSGSIKKGAGDGRKKFWDDDHLREIRKGLSDFEGLCCTNRPEGELPLTPDGFILQPLFEGCQAR